MSTTTENNKRIAKNTLFLYFRMLLIMAVTLYTSRVVLRVLGVEDFGIYNVVGGVVATLNVFTGSLSGASSRFITFALGKGDGKEVRLVFSTVLTIHFVLAGLLAIVAETAGLWFVLNKLVIPAERMGAALWVYHCSILTMVVSFISVPYNALIIAHERMSAFAYISVLEVLLKLGVAWFLLYMSYDKLVVYALLLMAVQVVIRMAYGRYCSSHFPESKMRFTWKPELVKRIFSYVGWTFNGNLAVMGYTQGINILLNLFFGPVVNAARGIAVQVQSAVTIFVQNFQTAIRPQVVKSYAAGDLSYMHSLVIASSKYGFYLVLLIVAPLYLCINPVLRIWLGTVPAHTADFVRIMFYVVLLWPLRGGMVDAIHATGDIKRFQIYEGTTLLLVVPVAYLLLRYCHITPEMVMVVYFCVELIAQALRVWIVLGKISLGYKHYAREVVSPVLLLAVVTMLPVHFLKVGASTSFPLVLAYAISMCLYVAVCVYVIGLKRSDRKLLWGMLRKAVASVKR